jgi:hypothetical protein
VEERFDLWAMVVRRCEDLVPFDEAECADGSEQRVTPDAVQTTPGSCSGNGIRFRGRRETPIGSVGGPGCVRPRAVSGRVLRV